MVNTKMLPHLINLLDDPSPEIRNSVLSELDKYGMALEEEIVHSDIELDPLRKLMLETIFEKNDRALLKKDWMALANIQDETSKLETGLELICSFQNGRFYPAKLSSLIDELVKEYYETYLEPDTIKLVYFLFQQKRLKGADRDYYNPMNSNLVYVLEYGQGIPISLVAILILAGQRLGLEIDGCNFPGHFLARFNHPVSSELILVDCYNGGHLIYESDMNTLAKDTLKHLAGLAHERVDSITMLRRVLGNLANSYQKNGDVTNQEFFEALLERT